MRTRVLKPMRERTAAAPPAASSAGVRRRQVVRRARIGAEAELGEHQPVAGFADQAVEAEAGAHRQLAAADAAVRRDRRQ